MPRARSVITGYVYLVRSMQKSPRSCTKLYKIGCSRDPHKRFRDIRSAPSPMTLVAIAPTYDMYGLEGRLHERFAKRRINYEWFALTHKDIQLFNRLTVTSVTAIPHDAKAPKISASPDGQRPIVLRKRLV